MSEDNRFNRAHVRVAPPFLVSELNLPLGTEIIGCEWDFSSQSVVLHVTNATLMKIPAGCPSPQVNVIVTSHVDHDRLVPERTYSSVFQ